MSRPKVREWLFNSTPPSAIDMLRSQKNGPLIKSLLIIPDENATNGTFSDAVYKSKLDDLYVHAYKLRCGTELGFLLNANGMDIGAGMFSVFDKSFVGGLTSVCRMVASTYKGRLFLMEFCWLLSGALTVRFLPCGAPLPSLSPEMKLILPEVLARQGDRVGNAFGVCFVYAFSPHDAMLLTLAASQVNPSFLAGRIDLIGLSERCYRVSVYDSAFQSPCVFCITRGYLTCACPMPIRRRADAQSFENMMSIFVHRDRSIGLWTQFCSAMATSRHHGSYIYNMSMNLGMNRAMVLDSGLTSFHYKITTNARTHAAIQRILNHSSPAPFSVGRLPSSFDQYPELEHSGSGSRNRNQYIDVLVSEKETKRSRPSDWQDSTENVTPAYGLSTDILNALDDMPYGEGLFGSSSPSNPLHGTSSVNIVSTNLREEERKSEEKENETNEGANKGDKVKLYKCPLCGIDIRSKLSNLKRHIDNKHRNERRFACEHCGKRFHTRMNLKRHVKTMHEPGREAANENLPTNSSNRERGSPVPEPVSVDDLEAGPGESSVPQGENELVQRHLSPAIEENPMLPSAAESPIA